MYVRFYGTRLWIKKQEEWFFSLVLPRESSVRGMVDSDVFIEYYRLILFFFSDVLFNVLLPSSKQVGFIKYIVSSSCSNSLFFDSSKRGH